MSFFLWRNYVALLECSDFGKFLDVADRAVRLGIDHLTGEKDFFHEPFKVLAVLCAHKVIGV
jgi:hypothetical protein